MTLRPSRILRARYFLSLNATNVPVTYNISQLGDATASLTEKSEAIAALEEQVASLKASLDAALADVNSKTAAAEELATAKSQAESELAELKQALETLKTERDNDEALLKSVQSDVCPNLPSLHFWYSEILFR